jgi:hypothetical protein
VILPIATSLSAMRSWRQGQTSSCKVNNVLMPDDNDFHDHQGCKELGTFNSVLFANARQLARHIRLSSVTNEMS